MSVTSEIILSVQTHPVGNSEESVTGNSFKGDGYYNRSDGFHTVQYSVIGFVGTIKMQATLSTSPAEGDWFTVSDSVHTSANTNATESNGSFIKNFTGNYVWVRAVISGWTAGTVSSILLNH
jgi:hypothetical protein